MTFDDIVNQANERRGVHFEQLLALMDHGTTEVEQTIGAYRIACKLFREMLQGDRYGDCPVLLRRFAPHAVFGILDPAAFGANRTGPYGSRKPRRV